MKLRKVLLPVAAIAALFGFSISDFAPTPVSATVRDAVGLPLSYDQKVWKVERGIKATTRKIDEANEDKKVREAKLERVAKVPERLLVGAKALRHAGAEVASNSNAKPVAVLAAVMPAVSVSTFAEHYEALDAAELERRATGLERVAEKLRKALPKLEEGLAGVARRIQDLKNRLFDARLALVDAKSSHEVDEAEAALLALDRDLADLNGDPNPNPANNDDILRELGLLEELKALGVTNVR